MIYKKGNIVSHPKMDWGQGVVMENSDEKTVEVLFEKVGRKKLSLLHVTPRLIDTTILPAIEIKRLEVNDKIYEGIHFVDIFNYVKSVYPDHLVIIENGCYFEVIEEDAQYLSQLYGWTIYERQHGVLMTGFPENAKNIWNDLVVLEKPYLIVSQLPNTDNSNIKRKIMEVYPI